MATTTEPEAPAPTERRPRRRRRRPVVRLRDLPSAERKLLVGLLVAIGAVPFVVAILALVEGWQATGDNAIIGIQVRSLLGGKLPLVGLPTTGENFGSGVESSHPGPMALYLLAPFVAIFGGTVGLALGAAAINSAAWVLASFAAFRRGGLLLAALTGVSFCLLARGLGPFVLADPISSNLGAYPSLAFALLTWAVLAGDRDLLPWCVAVGTFTIQAHLTYVAWGAGLTLVLLGALLYQQRQRPLDISRRTVIASVVVAEVLWLPVLLDQLFGSHNISALFETFTSGESVGKGVGFAFGRLLYAVGIPPVWLQRISGLDFLLPLKPLTAATALAVFALLGAVGFVRVRGRVVDPSMRLYLLVVGAVLATSVYSAINLPEAAAVKASNLRWMWTLGLLVWLGAFGGGARIVLIVRRVRLPRAVPLAALAVAALLVVVEVSNRDPRDHQVREVVKELDAVAADVEPGTYRVVYEGNSALLTVGPAFAFALADDGSKVLVEAGQFTRAYGDAASYDGQRVDGTFFVSTGEDPKIPAGFDVKARTTYLEKPNSADPTRVVLAFSADA